jgi:hypothetical protein
MIGNLNKQTMYSVLTDPRQQNIFNALSRIRLFTHQPTSKYQLNVEFVKWRHKDCLNIF